MSDLGLGDGLRKVFLAGVGALATTVEKSQEIVEALVKKGELTVDQGKALNAELKHRSQEYRAPSQDGGREDAAGQNQAQSDATKSPKTDDRDEVK